MDYRFASIALLTTSLTVAACDPPAEYDERPEAGEADELMFRTTYGSGSGANPPVYSNTCAIGDHPLNEIDAGGKLHGGVQLRGVYPWDPVVKAWAGTTFAQVWVDPTGEIKGRRNQVIYGGDQMVGTRWLLDVEQDGVVEAREMTIHAHNYDPAEQLHTYVLGYPNDPSYGIHVYDSAAPLLTGNKRSACVPDEDGNIEAVMLADHHIDLETSEVSERPQTLVFACMSGALGKALRWGYRPGSLLLHTDAYETAIRMVRADYCGDGVSWTEPGQEIDIQDRWKIHDWRNPAQFPVTEAIWGPKGAICIGTPRLGQFDIGDIICPQGPLPACNYSLDQQTYELGGNIWTRVAAF